MLILESDFSGLSIISLNCKIGSNEMNVNGKNSFSVKRRKVKL